MALAVATTLAACDGGDASPPPVWRPLVALDWAVQPGEEQFQCAVATITEPTFVRRFRARAPSGTHHMLVTVAAGRGPEGAFACTPGTLSDVMLFASGVLSDELELPAGVAMRLPAESQVLLNTHLLNTSPLTLEGTSGVDIQTMPASEVLAEAEMVFAGPTGFALPPRATTTASGSCTFRQDASVSLLWPHMHTRGTQMRIVHHGPAGATVLHDAPYDFGHQRVYPIPPTRVAAGERIEVTCTWHNPGDEAVTFGDSTWDEMCFAGLVRYPAAAEGLYCLDDP
jgi:hypothetical protein